MTSTVDKYKQLIHMGPRRSGRTVANLIAASIVASYRGGDATVVVVNQDMVKQIDREWTDIVYRMGFHRKPKVATLHNMTSYRGPFFVDHYAVEHMFSEIIKENAHLTDRVTELEGKFI